MERTLANKINYLAEKNNLSIMGLEKKAGLKIHAVRNILIGHTKKPSAETILAIARALNCSIYDLLEIQPLEKDVPLLKIKDIKFSSYPLLNNITHYVINEFQKKKAPIQSYQFFEIIQDIYMYSYEHNDRVLDEKFASWLIKKSLP